MQIVVVILLVILIPSLALALIGYLLRPIREDDAMPRVVGDAPRFVRGGYRAMGEREPIYRKRAS